MIPVIKNLVPLLRQRGIPVHVRWVRIRMENTWQPIVDCFMSILIAKILPRYRGVSRSIGPSVGRSVDSCPSATAGYRYGGWRRKAGGGKVDVVRGGSY